ncbi:putative reverse transcriptase domain-containing protein [Tanacetum coccineum]
MTRVLIPSPVSDARLCRAADRAEDVGYVRALQASKHRMMTSIKEVNLRVSYQVQVRRQESEDFYTQLHDARTDRRDIRLKIMALLVRLETLETHISHMEWQRQRAEDDAVRQMMRTHVLEARAQIDTVEDTGSSCVVGLSQWLKRWNQYFTLAVVPLTIKDLSREVDGQVLSKRVEIKKLEIKLWNLRVRGNDVAAYTQRFQELALMCTKFLADETEKIDKYISGLLDNIHRNVMSVRPKTLDEAIELANDLMDQKLALMGKNI